ncbi:MAG: hypothetical protein CMO01_08070 [Thalassobius sp.]|nr:hypothetical protein [Thalassovita sp.]
MNENKRRINHQNDQTIFTLHDIELLKSKGLLFDGRKGGLVKGKLEREGGIMRLVPYQFGTTIYKLSGSLEGGEYITAPVEIESNRLKFKKLAEMVNKIRIDEDICIKIPETCKLIDTSQVPDDQYGFVLCEKKGQIIIHRAATEEFIEEIVRLDKN